MVAQIGQLAGGLGLFLLGMWLMTDGLKLAAGGSLRDILARGTRTRWHGLASGFGVTALVQSSSAVTVATIGFVNAGLLGLSEAVWIVFGSNVGTTATGWLVALIGLNVRIEAFALPAVAIGMVLRLFGRGIRRIALGEAIAGFGVFFLGISVLKAGFEGLAPGLDVGALAAAGWTRDAVLVGIGLLATVLTQSSSAAIAIALAATASGLLPLEPGAAMVIGANLGTTSTALFATIGATPNAKRVALAHVGFNGLTAIVAFLLLPWVVAVSDALGSVLGVGGAPAAVLALFHTVFNTLGVVLMWPIADRFVRFLAGRFVTDEEVASRPRFLGPAPESVPALAVESLRRELWRLDALAADAAATAIGGTAAEAVRLARQRGAVEALGAAIAAYMTGLRTLSMPESEAVALEHALRALQHCEEVAALTEKAAALTGVLRAADPGTAAQLAEFRRRTLALLAGDAVRDEAADDTPTDALLDEHEAAYQTMKRSLLAAGATGEMAIGTVNDLVDLANVFRQVGERALKSARRLRQMKAARISSPADEPAAPT